MNPQRRKVFSLIRVSDNVQAGEDRNGIPRQRNDNRRTAARQDLEIVKELEVIDVSGKHVASDPQFQELFRALKRPDIAGVVVSSTDRIFRPQTFGDFAILDHFQQNKKLIWTAQDCIDPNTNAGWWTLLAMGGAAGQELQWFRKRALDAKERDRKKGWNPNGSNVLPRGISYDKATKQWSADPIEVARMRKAAEMVLEGSTWQLAAHTIGGGWTSSGLKRALQNPIWIGVRRYDRGAPL
jgi:DNA invertase Pin-like site-specific DNA recombinase